MNKKLTRPVIQSRSHQKSMDKMNINKTTGLNTKSPVDSNAHFKLSKPSIKKKFLDALKLGYNLITALKHAGISRGAYTRYVVAHPEFLEEIKDYQDLYIGEIQKVIREGLKVGDYEFALKLDKSHPLGQYSRAQEILITKSEQIDNFYRWLEGDEEYKTPEPRRNSLAQENIKRQTNIKKVIKQTEKMIEDGQSDTKATGKA